MRTLLRINTVVALVVALLLPALAAAQDVTVPANTPVTLAWDHDGVDTTGYRISNNGQPAGEVPITALANGSASFTFGNGLTAGQHVITVVAFNGTGVSEPGTLVVSAGGAVPTRPGNLRITVSVTVTGANPSTSTTITP